MDKPKITWTTKCAPKIQNPRWEYEHKTLTLMILKGKVGVWVLDQMVALGHLGLSISQTYLPDSVTQTHIESRLPPNITASANIYSENLCNIENVAIIKMNNPPPQA